MSHIPNPRVLALAAVLAAVAALPAHAQEAAPAASPCADSTYQALKGRDAGTLSEAEKQDLAARDQACKDHLQASGQEVGGSVQIFMPAVETSQIRWRRAPTTTGEGVDLYVYNYSTVALIIESVRVFDCQEIRQVSCTTHRPRTLIPPNQEKRVITIRYREGRERPARYDTETRIVVAEPRGES